MRTAIYARYSSIKAAQRGGVSIADQLKRLREAAEENGEEVVAELVDQARSGTEMRQREAFQSLLLLAKEGSIDLVRIESVDRANRNELDRRVFEQELGRCGVEIVYLGEDIDQPPEQRVLNRGLRGTVAEFESLQISQRVYKRMRFRAEQGKWRGGRWYYGITPNKDGWFDPDPETYPFLLHILRRAAEGWGGFRICSELNKGISIDGAPPTVPPTQSMLEHRRRPRLERMDDEGNIVYIDKRPPATVWHANVIRSIIKEAVDGIYSGNYRWGETYFRLSRDAEGRKKTPTQFQHPPLVPLELITVIREHARVPQEPRKGGRPSTALLKPVCGLCGGFLTAATTVHTKLRKTGEKTYAYHVYRCERGVNSGRANCDIWTIPRSLLDREVVARVNEQLQLIDPAVMEEQLRLVAKSVESELDRTLAALENQLAEAEKLREENLNALVYYGETLSEAIKTELIKRTDIILGDIERIKRDKQTTETALTRLAQHAVDFSVFKPIEVPDNWDDPDVLDSLRRALSLVVAKVVVAPIDSVLRRKRSIEHFKIEVELRSLPDFFP